MVNGRCRYYKLILTGIFEANSLLRLPLISLIYLQ